MSKARSALLNLLPHRYPVALALWLGFGSAALALEHCDAVKPAEVWARCLIEHGEWADFNKRCSTKTPPDYYPCSANPPLDPKKEECRTISSYFVAHLLAGTPQQEKVPFAGVQIAGARIVGDVKLEDTKFIRPIKICNSRIEGEFNLDHAQTDSLISLNGSLMIRNFLAEGLVAERDLFLYGAAFKSDVKLTGAKIDGDVNMIGAHVDGKLDAPSLQVGGSLLMQSDGPNNASFKEVNLPNANIKGQLAMFGASVDGKLDAPSLQVGGSLLMQSDGTNNASFKEVVLYNAKITREIDMSGANFAGALYAGSLQVDRNLNMRDAHYDKRIVMVSAHVGGNLDLRGARLASLDLSGASIAEDLRLGGESEKPAAWTCDARCQGTHPDAVNALNLRNAHVGNLVDATDERTR
jgi:uncharacterized protein YjbI with pentapeptide repeats